MKSYKRALTSAQAAACENARYRKCVCRCGGALYGINHQHYMEVEQEIINSQGEISEELAKELANES